MGLMQALELVEDRETKKPASAGTNALMEEARKRGLLVGKGRVLRQCDQDVAAFEYWQS